MVSEGLVNQFSAKMQGLASDYNTAVSRLWSTCAKRWRATRPSHPRFAMLSAAIAGYDDEFNTFENDLKALVKKHFLESDEAHVFNWLEERAPPSRSSSTTCITGTRSAALLAERTSASWDSRPRSWRTPH